jgi:hypothetical protein
MSVVPGSAMQPLSRRGLVGRLILWIPVIAVALLMLPAPNLYIAPAQAGPTAPTPLVIPVPPSHPASPPTTPGVTPGVSVSSLLPMINRFANASVAAGRAFDASSDASAPTSAAAAPAAPSRAPPTDVNLPTGLFVGTVGNASNPSGGIVGGVSIQAYPDQAGQFCTDCAQATSNATGQFSVTCPVGRSYITFSKSFWTQNLTYATCVVNATVNVGTVYLIPSGVVKGTVLADRPLTPGLGGVTVQGESRDFTIIANPIVETAPNGTFTVAIPPSVAGRIDFTSPGAGYQNNFTYVSVASGQTVNIGIVYLEPNSVVQAKLYDLVTGAAIPGFFQDPLSLTVCSSVTTTCGSQGPPTISGNTVDAAGPPGYDFVKADAPGYIENDTPVGYVPPTGPGHTFCVPNDCKIYLTPIGTIKLKTAVSGYPPSAFGFGEWYTSSCGYNGFDIAVPQYNPATYTYNTTTTDCLDGGCESPGAGTFVVPGIPIRTDLVVQPDTTAVCGFFPTWPIPGLLPVWSNETWVNVTPDMNTNVGWLNLTPGTYIRGNVYVQGTDVGPSDGFSVSIESRIDTTLTTYPFVSGDDIWACPGSQTYTSFCAPAPPGPSRLLVSAANYPENYTWTWVEQPCCALMHGAYTLAQATDPSIGSINLTVLPTVNGSVIVAGGSEPVGYGTVTVCPAAASSTPCADGLVGRGGGFSIPYSPTGWDQVSVSAGGYAPGAEWEYVGANVTVPTIPLTPMGLLEGYVTSTNGSAVIDASVYACPIATAVSTGNCAVPLGSGITTTGGLYEGLEPGGWLPGSTYQVQASAPGFVTDWTWANATVNQSVTVPGLVLAPVGDATPRAFGVHGAATTSNSAWVDGDLVDNSTGRGIETQAIVACPTVSTLVCTTFSDGSNTGGFYNDSLAAGVYNFTVTAEGYFANTTLLTVPSGVSSFLMPTLRLTPLDWVNGTVLLDPWYNITVNYDGLHTFPLMPPTRVEACTTQFVCGSADPSATDGAYQIQSYPGHLISITADPTYAGNPGSAPGGMVENNSLVNISQPFTALSVNDGPSLELFAEVSGKVYDAQSCTVNTTGATVCATPAQWTTVLITTSGVNNGAATMVVTGSGNYTGYIPGGNDQGSTRVLDSDPNFYYSNFEVVNAQLGPSNVGGNLSYVAPPLEVSPFGYATAQVVDSVTGAPLAGQGVTATYSNTLAGIFGSTNELTNGAGYLNMTAPSAAGVEFAFGGVNYYNSTDIQAPVSAGNTTNLDNWSIGSGPVQLNAWGLVGSEYLDYGAPSSYLGTVMDPAVGEPLAYASIAVTSIDPAIGSGDSLPTNQLGEFLSEAPIGRVDTLSASLPGYSTATITGINVSAGSLIQYPTIDLTGDGIVSSQVVAQPGGLPVSGAEVQICAGTANNGTICTSTVTNATGHYWLDVTPGHLAVSVSATGFVSNYTETATIHTDQWETIPTYSVVEDGTLTGIVRGLPTGLPIASAGVAACSPLGGYPTGPCSFTVTTLSNGTFSIPVVPSQYILAVTANDFNTTYLSVSVLPGAVVNMGPIFLEEYGIVAGTVEDAVGSAPLPNATVSGYPEDPIAPGVTPATTDLSGNFRIAAPPGGVLVVVTLAGYEPANLSTTVTSGGTTTLPTIQLVPLPSEQMYRVNGTTLLAGAPPTAFAGVSVTLTIGSTVAVSTVSGAGGAFSLVAPEGDYVLRATLPGYVAVAENLTLNEPLSGLDLTLALFGWQVSGTVTDLLTGSAVADVALWSSTAVVGETDAAGEYSLALPNGTYTLQAVPGGAGAAIYPPIAFQVVVAAGPVQHDLTLQPASVPVTGTVTSASDNSPIAGASIVVTGVAVDGANESLPATTDSLGHFTLAVYLGQYTVTASAAGFRTASTELTVGANTPNLALVLTPTSPAATTPSMGTTLAIATVAAVAVAAVAAVGIVLNRRRGGSA